MLVEPIYYYDKASENYAFFYEGICFLNTLEPRGSHVGLAPQVGGISKLKPPSFPSSPVLWALCDP